MDIFATEENGCRTIYQIPAENLPKFEAEMEKLSKRSMKLIGQPILFLLLDYEDKKLSDGHMHRVYNVYFNVDIPKLDGWKFVAKIDHSQEVGNVLRTVPNIDVVVPESYRTRTSFCDHCNSARYRRNTYIVCHEETNEFKQVGSTCLHDFLGHDVHRHARYAEFLSYATEIARSSGNIVGTDMRWIHTETFIAHAVMAIRKHGWVSATKARQLEDYSLSTRSRAYDSMFPDLHGSTMWTEPEKPSAEDYQIAADAIAWVSEFDNLDRSLSDYEHNALIISKSMMIEHQHIGIAASIPAIYLKHIERLKTNEERKKALRDSEYVGEVGVRQEFGTCRVLSVNTTVGQFGTTWIYTFTTENNDVLVWFASKSAGLFKGTLVSLKGTVKKHEPYKERKQTIITRCKVEAIEEEVKQAA